MKNTPFTEKHLALGARMAPFAGYNMPISYTGINQEHLAVRKNAGVFDVSHMGEFLVRGPKALDLIQKLCSNDAEKLVAGKAQYSCLINEEGGIIDDLIVYCLEPGALYMLVVNAANMEKDWAWISKWNTEGAILENISDGTGLLAVQGPNAVAYMQELTQMDLTQLKFYHFVKGEFAGVPNVLISATGYTGSGGVEIYFEDKEGNADKIWSEIFRVGEPEGLVPVGLGARDTLRLEMGFCLYGHEIDETTHPFEAGLGWITKFSKPFIGSEILQKKKEEGPQRKLIGFEMLERGIPRQGYVIANEKGETLGHVTSGTQSPSLSKAIGLGYVSTESAKEGTELAIMIRNQPVKAKIVKFPFA